MTIKDDDISFSLTYSTDNISFADDEKGFASFPADGVLRYQKDGKKIVVSSDASGKIAYEINGGEKKQILTEEEKKIVTGVLKKLAELEIKSDENWKSLINATAKLGADYEKGETLRFIATKMPASTAVKDAFLQSAKTIGADYEYGKTIRALK